MKKVTFPFHLVSVNIRCLSRVPLFVGHEMLVKMIINSYLAQAESISLTVGSRISFSLGVKKYRASFSLCGKEE
jgi:hypothetical protein